MDDSRAAEVLSIAGDAVRNTFRTDPDRDDLVQEAALALLTAMDRHPGMPRAYYYGAAKRHVFKINRRGRPWTGRPDRKGKRPDPLGSYQAIFEDSETDPAFRYDDDLEAIELGLLRPRLVAAITRLRSDQQRTVARAVLAGLTPSEAGPIAGTTEGAGRAAWIAARRHLVAELEDLRPLVRAA